MSDSVPGESVPTCEICGANFANQDDLENHLNTHHNEMEASEADMKMHKCLDCGATFHSQGLYSGDDCRKLQQRKRGAWAVRRSRPHLPDPRVLSIPG